MIFSRLKVFWKAIFDSFSMHYFTDFCGNISKFQMADLALKLQKRLQIPGRAWGVTTSEEKAMPAAVIDTFL